MRQSRQMREELSPSEAARRLGATTRSVQRWIALGKLPARRVGGRWRVASDALDAFQSAGEPPTATGTFAGRPVITRLASPDGRSHPAHVGSADRVGAGRRIERVFIANRGEIARRIGRT